MGAVASRRGRWVWLIGVRRCGFIAVVEVSHCSLLLLVMGQQQGKDQLPVDVRQEVTSLSNSKTIWTVHYGTRRVREIIIINNLIPLFVDSLLMILY